LTSTPSGTWFFHLPHRYEHQPEACAIGELELGEVCTVIAGVEGIRSSGGYKQPSIVVRLVDATGRCSARWFNAAWIKKQIAPGDTIRITGTVGEYRNQPQFVNPSLTVVGEHDDEKTVAKQRFLPVYPPLRA